MAVHYFLICPILPLLTLVAVEALQYGHKGFETTLVPEIRGTPDTIMWKQAFRRVVEFDGSEESVHGTFRDRVVLDWHTASLTIKDLREDDSGPYELEATINNKKYYSQHEMAVIDKVAVPTISCVINGTVSGDGQSGSPRARATLRCSAEGPPSLILYHWAGVAVGGPELPVVLAGDQDETVYTCRATNPVSREMGTFVAKDCYPDSFSPSGLIIAIVVICLLLVLSAGCFLGYRRWKKAHPETSGIEDVEGQPLHRSNGSDTTKAYDKDNGATLPSSQRLALLSHADPAMDSTSGQEEDQTTYSGGCGDSIRVSVHSSESRLPEPQQPTALESKLSAGDSASVLEEPALESESHLPPTASPAGCGLHPVVTELDATETRSHRDGEATRLSSSSLQDLQSSSLKTTDHATKAGPSPALPETAPDNQSDSDVTAPQPLTPRDGHLGSDEGGQAAHADLYASDPAEREPAAVTLREREEEALAPLSVLSSSEVEREEEEEERKGTGEECVSTGDEPSGERLVAADDPPVNVEALPAEMEEEDAEAAHGGADLQEEGEAEEEDGADGQGVSSTEQASQPETRSDSDVAGDRGTVRSEDDAEETLHTPEDKRENVEDGTGRVTSSAEPNLEAIGRREEEEDNDVTETSHDDPHGPEEDDGKDRGVASLPASEPESHRDPEAVAGEGDSDTSVEEETLHTPEDNAEDGTGQVALPAEPAMETPERKVEDVPQTLHEDTDVQEEGEVEEDDGKDGGVASLPASRPETQQDSEAAAGESNTETSVEEETLDMETPERKEEVGDVPRTVRDDADVQEEGEVEEEGGREGQITGLIEMESGPETGPDPDRDPGESGASREETQGTGGNHEERKEETGDGPLPANHDVEEGERRDGNKEANNEASTE